MLTIRPAEARGEYDFGWLKTAHSFSFGHYHDPAHMGFSDLRVINQDYVEPGKGFDTHPHKDMEIITYVLDGALAHKDSVGNSATIRRGEVQRMSAGTGITHSEFNASETEGVEFLQIWVLPDQRGHKPGYEQKPLSGNVKNAFGLIASGDGREDSVSLNQDQRGQYRVRGAINMSPVTFLVDTGASLIAMSERHARAVGLDYSQAEVGKVQTAQGLANAYFTNLAQVSIGGIMLHNVKATVITGDYPTDVLLGMSFLNQVNMRDMEGVLTLTARF